MSLALHSLPLLLTSLLGLSNGIVVANPARQVVVISDLHMGVGPALQPHPFEDFRWTADFQDFLTSLREAGPTDLVLNGDTFELWQSTEDDCHHQSKDYGCTENEAVKRITRVLKEHAKDLQLVRDFANADSNHVYIVPGNHDQALLFDDVSDAVLKHIGANADRVTILSNGVWSSDDGQIVAFHGHQLDDFNRAGDDPFILDGEHRYLRRPAGEQLVREFYNEFETRYPIIDNIGSEMDGLAYGYAAEGTVQGTIALTTLVRFLCTRLSPDQAAGTLGGKDQLHSVWDLRAVRAQGPTFLAQSLPTADVARPAFAHAVDAKALDQAFNDLSESDLRAICDAREEAAATNAGIRCPRMDLGRARSAVKNDMARRLQNELGKRPGHPQVIVLSHTHHPAQTQHIDPDTGRRAQLVNTGAWQRTITPQAFEQLQKRRKLSIRQALQLQPDQLPACYPFVVIQGGGKAARAFLWYWQGSGAGGRQVKTCDTKSIGNQIERPTRP